MAGTLYLCATPIGNLEDMTFRVIRTLKEVDLIAAEDTRNSIKLLNHFEIQTPMTSYHEYNKYEKGRKLVEKLQEGMNIALITDAGTPGISDPGEELVKMCYEAGISVTSLPGAAACEKLQEGMNIALITDAGTPGISDPGEELVKMCYEAGISVTSLPGAAACITALTISGLSTRRFAFEAFLPSDKKEREQILRELETETRTMILYEAPHRLVKTLKLLLEHLGNRKITVCRELTKRHETAFAATLEDAVAHYETNAPKGECVLVLEGKSREQMQEEERKQWEDMTIEDHMEVYLKQGMDKKSAMKAVAKDRGVSKREIYQYLESGK